MTPPFFPTAAVRTLRSCAVLLCSVALIGGGVTRAQVTPSPGAQKATFTVESYYRIRWGREEEFMALFRKNHLPFVRRMMEKGIVVEARLDRPREHMPEDARWDLRMTLVYRDVSSSYSDDNISESDYSAIVKDDVAEAVFKHEEQRRFELLQAHWDVNVKSTEIALEATKK